MVRSSRSSQRRHDRHGDGARSSRRRRRERSSRQRSDRHGDGMVITTTGTIVTATAQDRLCVCEIVTVTARDRSIVFATSSRPAWRDRVIAMTGRRRAARRRMRPAELGEPVPRDGAPAPHPRDLETLPVAFEPLRFPSHCIADPDGASASPRCNAVRSPRVAPDGYVVVIVATPPARPSDARRACRAVRLARRPDGRRDDRDDRHMVSAGHPDARRRVRRAMRLARASTQRTSWYHPYATMTHDDLPCAS